jgi:RNA polymerase sigma factor (sigma-70 family)
VEASAIPASVGLARTRIAIGASLLRIRTDEQLVTLFREGNDEAFRVIHDRYRARMFAYARQMLGTSGQDPEDAVQEIFMRAYYGLRANHRQLALRAWLYRIAHNRCVDDLRRPQILAIDARDSPCGGSQDPVIKVEQRDALRRLISDVQRLPDQQRSALLMRELSGMSYADVSGALGVSIPAVKSLLVRARVGLAQASEARNTACSDIRADLILASHRGVRTSGLARRHLRECRDCREFRSEVRGVNRQLAALTPALGPLGIIANLLGWGSAGAATSGGGAVASSGAAAASGSAITAGGSAAAGAASAGLLAGGAGHVATLLAAAVVTAGGAVELQNTLSAAASHHSHRHALVAHATRDRAPAAATGADVEGAALIVPGAATVAGASGASQPSALAGLPGTSPAAATGPRHGVRATPITMLLDPDMYSPPPSSTPPAANDPNAPGGGTAPTSSTSAPGSPAGATSTGSPSTSGATPSTPSSSSGTAPATAPTPSSGAGSSSGTTASGSSGSTAPADSSSTSSGTTNPSSGTSASTSANQSKKASTSSSTSVGQSTSWAGSRKVVSFIQHRRSRHHRMLDTLVAR